MRGDRVPQAMAREVPPQACSVSMRAEELLDLAFAKGSAPTGKKRSTRFADTIFEVAAQQGSRAPKERSLGPCAAL